MARPSVRAPWPRAPAPRAGRAAPRARRGGRKPARASLGDELEAALDVADLPPLGADRLPQTVGALEIARRAGGLPLLGKLADRRRRVGHGCRDAEEREATANLLVRAPPRPPVEDRERLRSVEVVRQGFVQLRLVHLGRSVLKQRVPERREARGRLLHRLVGEVDRLRPVAAQEEEEQRLAAPAVEGVADRDDVALRLPHLLAGEAEHPVVRPDAPELVPERARLRQLVLVVREDEVEPAAVDLEGGPEELLGHNRALDVPARSAATPGRVPPRVLAGLVRLPQREVARILLERVRLLVLVHEVVGALAREPTVLRVARDAEVDVALDVVRESALDQLGDEADDLGDGLGRARQVVGPPEAEVVGVLEVPLRRTLGELGARARRRLVDLVVDVRDVVDEDDVVAAP